MIACFPLADDTGEEVLSEALVSIESLVKRSNATNLSPKSVTDDTQSLTTDESSMDFDLPDESHFLESSIRLTREDMKTPLQSDHTARLDSDSDTEQIYSRDEILPNSTSTSV